MTAPISETAEHASMSLPTQTQVLIVGAGPTGMACALALVSLGLEVTIVDASSTSKNGSRAGVIHARTLEVLDTVGLAKPLVEAGIQSKGATVHAGTMKLMDIDVGQLCDVTKFPIALLMPQYNVEAIFQEKLAELGVEILRPHTVVDIRKVPSGDGLDVVFDDGSVIRTLYVVGADGSRSAIRRLADIEFKDPKTGFDYDWEIPPGSAFQIVLADVYMEEPLPAAIPRDSLSLQLKKFFFMCPLPSGEDIQAKNTSFWRIRLGFPSDAPPPPRNPDITWLQAELNRRSPWKTELKLASVATSSRYRARAAVASTLFQKIGGETSF